MSLNQIYLCSFLLEEFFGEIVKCIGCHLLRNGPCTLKTLTQVTAFKTDQVKKALCCLLQHGLCVSTSGSRGQTEYATDVAAVLLLPRHPHLIYAAKLLYGDAGELVLEELLHHGRRETSALLKKVEQRLNDAYQVSGGTCPTPAEVREKMAALAQTHFIMHAGVKATVNATDGSTTEPSEEQLYGMPEPGGRKRKAAKDISLSACKRPRISDSDSDEEGSSTEDTGVWWQVNFSRFMDYMRDQTIINAVAKKIDKRAGEIVRAILRVSEVKTHPDAVVTQPASFHEIYAKAAELGLSQSMVEQYLTVLSEDTSNIVLKAGESGGGMYSVHLRQAMASLCKAHVESVVQERFGSKCLRIFRLLILKKQLEQKQIEELAMIPAKEAKEMLYRMFGEGFITLTEVPKTPDHAPSRTFYLFSVSLNSIARMLLEKCYKALANVISRRQHENKEHRRLLEKQQRVDAIALQLEQSGADAAQRQELEEMITPPERATLSKVKHCNNKLEQSEIQLDHTIFTLETYLRYSHLPT